MTPSVWTIRARLQRHRLTLTITAGTLSAADSSVSLRDPLGQSVEELLPLHADSRLRLDGDLTGDVRTERLILTGTEPVRRYLDGPAAGAPTITRHRLVSGTAWYVSTA